MASTIGLVFCLVYILGIAVTALPGQLLGIPIGNLALTILGVGAMWIAPRVWRTGPKAPVWLVVAIVGLVAGLYTLFRVPQPADNDISRFVPSPNPDGNTPAVQVVGQIESTPRLTRSERVQFWLRPTTLTELAPKFEDSESQESESAEPPTDKEVSGRLYVTVPVLWGTGLKTSQVITLTGRLYTPQPASNPGGFDFKEYLALEGGFAGMSAYNLEVKEQKRTISLLWWTIRHIIVKAQVFALGSPSGPLLSSIVLGGRVVDLPYDVRDDFARVGLAHAIAASGFHTSLILGVVMSLTQGLGERLRFGLGAGTLVWYTGLTGLQPSILRASLMGLGALAGSVIERKIDPVRSLLFVAVVLLVWNPLWLWDLGFQLSFLATLGLLVTVPPITKLFDWLPEAIATALAVPIAAYVWTLPLLLYTFGLVSPYTIVVNVLTSPLITLVSLGGMLSAFLALLWEPLGIGVAWWLDYPMKVLLWLVDGFNQLPGASYAWGTFSVVQLGLIYGLYALVCINHWWRPRWWMAGLAAVSLVVVPAWSFNQNLLQVTVLATSDDPVLVVQDRGRFGLVNSGYEKTADLSVVPFLQQRGVNRLDWAIATDLAPNQQEGWSAVFSDISAQHFYTTPPQKPGDILRKQFQTRQKTPLGDFAEVKPGQEIKRGSVLLKPLQANPAAWGFRIATQPWLLLGPADLSQQRQLTKAVQPFQSGVLWWTGKPLAPELIAALKPKVAIASGYEVDPNTSKLLKEKQIQLYWTGQDGALQWTPQKGFRPLLEANDVDATAL